jgi:ABC-2 type transport system ATP-binding protein
MTALRTLAPQRAILGFAPVVAFLAAGAAIIPFEAGSTRHSTHLVWITIVVAESAAALLLRRQHPRAALAGILAAYAVFDFPPISLPAALLALLTLATVSVRRTTLAATVASWTVFLATPIVHGDSISATLGTLAVLAAGLAALAGNRLRTQPLEERAAAVHTTSVVETHGITKRFGAATVVRDVELHVPCGTAFGYLGPNGAGKTTLIRMLLGLTKPTAGTMRLLGLPLPAGRRKALARVGAIVDEPRFHRHLTGRQNLWALAAAREPAAHARIEAALERVGLGGRADDRVGTYSMGMRQRLGIAACLIADPELLILDEPMNGLDPAGMLELRELIRSLVAEGRTVVLSSHLLDEVEKTCDQVAIVDRGRVVLQGRVSDLTDNSAAQLRVACADPGHAALLLRLRPDVEAVREEGDGLVVELATDDARTATAQIARLLLDAGFDLYQLQLERASLEKQFLEITTRLGEAA